MPRNVRQALNGRVVCCDRPFQSVIGPILGGFHESGALFVLAEHDREPTATVLSLPWGMGHPFGRAWGNPGASWRPVSEEDAVRCEPVIRRLEYRFGNALMAMNTDGGNFVIDGRKLPREMLFLWLKQLVQLKELEESVLGVGNSKPTAAMNEARRRWSEIRPMLFFESRHKMLDAGGGNLLDTVPCLIHDGDGHLTLRAAFSANRLLRAAFGLGKIPGLVQRVYGEARAWEVTPTSMIARTSRIGGGSYQFVHWMYDMLKLHFLETLQEEQEAAALGV